MGKSSRISSAASVSSFTGRRRLQRHQVWLAVAVLFAVAGVLATVAAAGSAARTDNDKSRVSFAQFAADIAASLRLAPTVSAASSASGNGESACRAVQGPDVQQPDRE